MPQGTEAEARRIAQAFWEFGPFLDQANKKPMSAGFLALASRLSRTGHVHELTDNFDKYGLTSEIPITFIGVGLADTHPVKLEDTVQSLATKDKLHLPYAGHKGNFNSVFLQQVQAGTAQPPNFHSWSMSRSVRAHSNPLGRGANP